MGRYTLVAEVSAARIRELKYWNANWGCMHPRILGMSSELLFLVSLLLEYSPNGCFILIEGLQYQVVSSLNYCVATLLLS